MTKREPSFQLFRKDLVSCPALMLQDWCSCNFYIKRIISDFRREGNLWAWLPPVIGRRQMRDLLCYARSTCRMHCGNVCFDMNGRNYRLFLRPMNPDHCLHFTRRRENCTRHIIRVRPQISI